MDCSLGNLKLQIALDVLQKVEDFKKDPDAKLEDFLDSIGESYKDSPESLVYVNQLLEDANLSASSSDEDPAFFEETSVSQLPDLFKSLELSNPVLYILVFGNNQKVQNYILDDFVKQAITYCIIDTEHPNNLNPLIQTSEQLSESISRFKQQLIEDLMEELKPEDDIDIVFDSELGADAKLYNDVIFEAFLQLSLFRDSEGNFKLQSLTLKKDLPIIRKFSKLLQLINFDYLLKQELGDFIDLGPAKYRNSLHHTKYKLKSVTTDEFQKIQVLMSDNKKNALDYCPASIKKLISFVPAVQYNLNTGEIRYDRLGQTLDPGTFTTLAPWIKKNIDLFKVYFNDPDLNIFKDPIGTFQKVLQYIHDSVVDYPNTLSDTDYRKDHWKEIKEFLKKNNTRKEIQTALSAYEYLFNDGTRINRLSRSVNTINKLFYSGIPTFNIVNGFVQQWLQSEAPALQEYNMNGTLLDADSVALKSGYDTTRKNHIYRAGQSSASFEIWDAITNTLFVESLAPSGLADTLIRGSKQKLSDALNDAEYVNALKLLLGVSEVETDTFKAILDDFALIHPEVRIQPIIEEIGQYLKSIGGKLRSRSEMLGFMLSLHSKADDFSKALKRDTLGSLLGSVLGSYTPVVYTTKEGNQIGILRTTSLVFLLDYCKSLYKQLRPEEAGKNESAYKPIRERCNILIDNEGLTQAGNNLSYLSQTATPILMGDESYNVERRKQAEYIQDLSNFVGDYISLMLGMKQQDSQSQFGVLLGAYSDKSYIPQLMINAKGSLRGIQQNIQAKVNPITVKELFSDSHTLHKYLKTYLSTSSLDNVNHEIDNWIKLITTIIDDDRAYPDWWSDKAKEFVTKLKRSCHINQEEDLVYRDVASSQSFVVSNISDLLLSDALNSHSDLFMKFMSDPSDTNYNNLSETTSTLRNILTSSANGLNVLFANEEMPDEFIEEVIPGYGQDLNIQITDKLSYDKYKGIGYLLNNQQLSDLVLNTTDATLPSSVSYQIGNNIVSGFDPTVVRALYDGNIDFSNPEHTTLENNQENYYYRQALLSLSLTYYVDGVKQTFFKYLVDWFNDSDNMALIQGAINMVSHGIKTPVTIFDDLYVKNKAGDPVKVNEQKLCEIYYNYLTATSFFRHQLLDVFGKESYVEKGANEDPEIEKSSRTTNGYKRFNIYTASYTPFIQNLIDGVSRKVKIVTVQDTKGDVFNTLGLNAELDEYDGMSLNSPIEVRMEAKSLNKSHAVSTQKTFIVPVGDYSAQELKWASDEITNQRIRESQHTSIPLESVFRRMHNIPFDYDITHHWDKYYTGTLDIEEFLGKPYYTRDQFDVIRYGEITYTGKNEDGINTYKISRYRIDGEDEVKIEPWEGPIQTIYDIYKAFDGINCGNPDGNDFRYSEDIMNLLSEFVIHVGQLKPGTSEINQETVELPLRDCFIAILVNKSANKRGSANINTGRIWTEDQIPLYYTEIDLTCGGEQLSAEEETDASEITRGSQMIQAAAQGGLTTEQATKLYLGLSKVMDINSESFNDYLEALQDAKSEQDVSLLQEYLSDKILKGLDLNGLNEDRLNLVRAFKHKAEKTGKFILPLSLLTKDLIKTIAPELNKEVIKLKDSGMMGVLNGSSGFLQTYEFQGKTYTMQDFLSSKNINKYNKFQDEIRSFLNSNPVTIDDNPINFEDVIWALSILELTGTELTNDNTINNLQDFFGDRLIAAVDTMIYGDTDEAFGYKRIQWQNVKPGLTVVPVTYDQTVEVDANGLPIEGTESISVIEGEPVKVTSNSDILSLYESGQELLLDETKPSDLKPQVFTITTESGQTENEYTSFEALLGERINRIESGNPGDKDYEIFQDIVSALVELDPNTDYSLLLTRLELKDLSKNDVEEIKQLREIQEDLLNFKNHIKSYGYTLPEYTTASEYFMGFNPRKNFTQLIQKRIVHDDYLITAANPDGTSSYTILNEDYIRNSLTFYRNTYASPRKKEALDRILAREDGIEYLVLKHPEFLFKHLGYNLHQVIRESIEDEGFDKIVKSNLEAAQIVMPLITRNLVKLGNIDLVDIDVTAFLRQRTYYDLEKQFFNPDGTAKVDFTVRRFNGKYNIAVLDDITKVVLDENGNPVKDADGNDILEITRDYGEKVDIEVVDGWRVNPRTKERIYRVPASNYEVRSNGRTETIVILNQEEDVLEDVENLINSNKTIISVQPFASNLLDAENVSGLYGLMARLSVKDEMRVFGDMYTRFKNITDKNQLKAQLSEDYRNIKDKYDSRFRQISFTSFVRSLDVISTRIPTQNMSSILTMKIASYTNNDVNDVFVTKWLQWIQGSDFD